MKKWKNKEQNHIDILYSLKKYTLIKELDKLIVYYLVQIHNIF